MGGVSTGELLPHRHHDRACLHLTRNVSTANNGGSVQMALDTSMDQFGDMDRCAAVEITIAGKGESHNVHSRTVDLWLPRQSYRAEFGAEWHTIRLPFADLEAYRTSEPLRVERLRRIGLVAIGRDFQTDLRLADMRFYDNNE
jgi:hypothetical protein